MKFHVSFPATVWKHIEVHDEGKLHTKRRKWSQK
ncbi:rCG38152 [Rattus norvegicus]|uniref:RCG38152 n=1 Tax=Rattus norvegicus TaxID=10116 RepID=A6IVB2_RAT|nr:rCG38152 [Rattus norvegicus]